MKIVVLILHTFILMTLVYFVRAITNLQIYQFTRNASLSFPRKRLVGHVLEEFSTKKQVIHCAYECLKSNRCRSFNYESDSFVCQINDGDHLEFHSSLVDGMNGSNQEYHHRAAFSLAQEALGPCAVGPCENDGRCLDTVNSKMERTYFCICTEDWMGQNCENPINRIDWDQWEEWGPCSVTCETGWTTRRRRCIDIETSETMSPSKCYGRDVEYQACTTQSCPRWLGWSGWSRCSTENTCGLGVMHRFRNCSNGGTPGKDKYCLGFAHETAPCQGIDCRGMLMLKDIVHHGDGRIQIFDELDNLGLSVCADDNWKYTEIDIACKQIGFQGAYSDAVNNNYNVSYNINDIPTYTLHCTGKEKYIQQCPRELVHQCDKLAGIQCRIRGGWGLWSSWGECSATCDDGTRQRTRECNHPPPNYDGTECPGEDTQMGPCTKATCPIDGSWRIWTNWGDCSVTCGDGLRNRTRICVEPEHGGATCIGPSEEAEECNHPSCPIDGVLAEWELWNDCSATCANGTRYRTRGCFGPFFGGANCTGPFSEAEICMMSECPVDGVWDTWQPWQECNVTCGRGRKLRQRLCIAPSLGGLECQGSAYDSEDCNREECPVDGEWKPWLSWETCNATCSGGLQRRTRDCVAPQNGGEYCIGRSEEWRECNTDLCPIDGIYTEWTEWSACSLTCGNGSAFRNRTCYGPYFDGAPCKGPALETTTCFVEDCPVPGNWHPWSLWTLCSVTCGGGVRYRNRTCDLESFGELTTACEGDEEEVGDCHTFDCTPLAIHCADWASRGLNQSCIADINPMNGPKAVECDFDTEPGEAITILHHDQENKTQVKGFEGAGMFEALLTYNIGWGEAIRIVDSSSECAQFIRWDCFAAIMHNPFNHATLNTFWMNRTEQMAYYFGGSTPGSGKCACGETNSCFNSSLTCNCDANDEVWRFDEGFITNKGELPVHSFHAGDTGGANEDGYMTVGPLFCSGNA